MSQKGGLDAYAGAGALPAVPLSTASSFTLSPSSCWLDASAESSTGAVSVGLDVCQRRSRSRSPDECRLTLAPRRRARCHLPSPLLHQHRWSGHSLTSLVLAGYQCWQDQVSLAQIRLLSKSQADATYHSRKNRCRPPQSSQRC